MADTPAHRAPHAARPLPALLVAAVAVVGVLALLIAAFVEPNVPAVPAVWFVAPLSVAAVAALVLGAHGHRTVPVLRRAGAEWPGPRARRVRSAR